MWGALRYADQSWIAPSDFELGVGGIFAKLTRTKTSGAGRKDLPYGDDVPLVAHQGEFGAPPAWRLEPRDYEDLRDWLGGFDFLEDASLRGECGDPKLPGEARFRTLRVHNTCVKLLKKL